MDLWVVNDTIRRSRMAGCSGPFRGPRRPDPGAFWPLGGVPAKGNADHAHFLERPATRLLARFTEQAAIHLIAARDPLPPGSTP